MRHRTRLTHDPSRLIRPDQASSQGEEYHACEPALDAGYSLVEAQFVAQRPARKATELFTAVPEVLKIMPKEAPASRWGRGRDW